jgi:hypothetical protein
MLTGSFEIQQTERCRSVQPNHIYGLETFTAFEEPSKAIRVPSVSIVTGRLIGD